MIFPISRDPTNFDRVRFDRNDRPNAIVALMDCGGRPGPLDPAGLATCTGLPASLDRVDRMRDDLRSLHSGDEHADRRVRAPWMRRVPGVDRPA